jgi:hypothetical protein
MVRLTKAEIWFRKGRLSYRRGDALPENIWPDEEWCRPLNEGQCFWLGYMVERGLRIMSQTRHEDAVRDYIEHGVDLPPDFNA